MSAREGPYVELEHDDLSQCIREGIVIMRDLERSRCGCRHLWFAACLLIVFAASALAQSFSPGEVRVSSSPYLPPQAALRVNTKEVQVEVVVRDSKGMPIGGLTQDQFQLLDKGQLCKITGFTAEVTNSARPISAYSKPKPSAGESAVDSASQAPLRPRFVAPHPPRRFPSRADCR